MNVSVLQKTSNMILSILLMGKTRPTPVMGASQGAMMSWVFDRVKSGVEVYFFLGKVLPATDVLPKILLGGHWTYPPIPTILRRGWVTSQEQLGRKWISELFWSKRGDREKVTCISSVPGTLPDQLQWMNLPKRGRYGSDTMASISGQPGFKFQTRPLPAG